MATCFGCVTRQLWRLFMPDRVSDSRYTERCGVESTALGYSPSTPTIARIVTHCSPPLSLRPNLHCDSNPSRYPAGRPNRAAADRATRAAEVFRARRRSGASPGEAARGSLRGPSRHLSRRRSAAALPRGRRSARNRRANWDCRGWVTCCDTSSFSRLMLLLSATEFALILAGGAPARAARSHPGTHDAGP